MEFPERRIYINSNSRSTGTSGNFTVALKTNPIEVSSAYDIFIAVTTATIPLTYFPISASNNQLSWSELGGDVTDTITPGYYTGSSFASAIEALLTDNSPGTLTYTVVYNSDTGKITITVPSGTLTLKFSSAASTLTTAMGFTTAGDIPVTTSLTSTNPISIGGPKTILIRINGITSNMYSTYDSATTNILAVIPVVGSRFNTTVFQPSILTPCRLQSTLRDISIVITDEYSNVLDFNGVNVDIELSIYKRQR